MNTKLRDDDIHNHYVSCSELRSHALKIQRTIGKVEDISVNASIVASQTGNQARVFFEISGQIEKTSRKMRAEMNMIIDVTGKLIGTVLSSKISKQYIGYYIASSFSQSLPSNYLLVVQTKERLEKNIVHNSARFLRGVKTLETHFGVFEFLINRIFVALTALRVEEELFRTQLGLGTVDSLIKSFENLLVTLSEDYNVFRDYFMTFQNIKPCTLE